MSTLKTAYLNRITYKKLTNAEEQSWAIRACGGDQKAIDFMATNNLRLVVKSANRYYNSGCRIDDLVAEGNLGLLRAVSLFKPQLGNRFSTYATIWIRNFISRYIDNNANIIRTPAGVTDLRKKHIRTIIELTRFHNRQPSKEEIACAMDMSVDDVCKTELYTHTVRSSAGITQLGQERDSDPIEDGVPCDQISPMEKLFMDDNRKLLDKALNLMPRPIERNLLIYKFGLQNTQSISSKEQCDVLGVSHARLRTLTDRAIVSIRNSYKQLNTKVDDISALGVVS